jgi:hypothetical protein
VNVAACIFHGEVIFPKRHEIVNGRYVMRRPKRPPLVAFTDENADSLDYKAVCMKITRVSRPVRWFGDIPVGGISDDTKEWMAGVMDPAWKIRRELHALEREVHELTDRINKANNAYQVFLSREDEGLYGGLPSDDFRILRGHYLGRVNAAQRCLEYACTKLQDFKKFVLPSVWPINRKGK